MSDALNIHGTRRTVVGGVLLARNHGLGVEKGAIGTSLDIVDAAGLEIDVKRARDVLARTGLGEEGRETTVRRRGGSFDEATVGLEKGVRSRWATTR